MSFPNPSRSSNLRTRISPPSEVTHDPWKSTFRSPLKVSWNGFQIENPGLWNDPDQFGNRLRIHVSDSCVLTSVTIIHGLSIS